MVTVTFRYRAMSRKRILNQATYRDLWSAVLLRAIHDLEEEDITSGIFVEAQAFFLEPSWLVSRQLVADMLDLHPEEVTRVGLKVINRRRAEAELPALPMPRPAKPTLATSRPRPALDRSKAVSHTVQPDEARLTSEHRPSEPVVPSPKPTRRNQDYHRRNPRFEPWKAAREKTWRWRW